MIILIDTGAAKNYVKPVKELKHIMPVNSPFTVSTIHGSSKIKNKCLMHIFGLKAPFFLLDTLSTFDAIIGFDLLTQAGAALDLRSSKIRYGNVTEQLKFFDCPNVNFTNADEIVVPNSVKADFRKIILKRSKVL